MDNHLLLQEKSRTYLLIRYTDRYHIIAVNNKLDAENEEKVLTGNCSDAAIDEMGLSRETILKRNLRGVAIGGSCAGDAVILYTKDRKVKYVLSDDYTDEDIHTIFPGIKRFQPPKNKGSKSHKADWRTPMQVKSTQKALTAVGLVLNSCGCLCFFGMTLLGRLNVIWSGLCLLLMAVSFVLYLIFPQYFSILDEKEYKRVGYKAKVTHLTFAIVMPGLALMIRTISDFHFFDWTTLLIASVVTSIAISAVMRIFSREVKENVSLLIVAALLGVFLSGGIVGQVNHLANFHADEPQWGTVVDTRRENGSKSGDHYYCTVMLESGTEMEVPVSGSTYRSLNIGSSATVYIGEGALGIEYAYFVDKE